MVYSPRGSTFLKGNSSAARKKVRSFRKTFRLRAELGVRVKVGVRVRVRIRVRVRKSKAKGFPCK